MSDGLFAPVNAPFGGQSSLGVQAGVTPGIVLASLVIIFGPGAAIFVYSGTPGPGTLVGSWAAAAGTDPFGNSYAAGITVGAGTASSPEIQLIPSAGGPGTPAVLQFTLLPLAFFGNQPNIQAASPGSSGQLIISGPGLAQAGFRDFVQEVYSSFAGAVPAAMQVNYVDIGGGAHTYENTTCSGVTISAGSINAADPTTGTAATPAIAEGWHAITLDANWSTLAGQPVPAYRFLADAGRKLVELIGAIQFNVNIANTNINAGTPLPAAYRPLTQTFIAPAPGSAGVSIQTNGVLVAAQIPGAATVFCNFNGIYPIDR